MTFITRSIIVIKDEIYEKTANFFFVVARYIDCRMQSFAVANLKIDSIVFSMLTKR